MALLSQKASWRRADPVVARSDDVEATAMSSVSRPQGGSLAGQKASSSLDDPVSSVTASVPSPASDDIPTSTTLPTTPAVISTASSPVTSFGTLPEPSDGASSPAPANVQSTISAFQTSPVSTISYPDPTSLIVSSSPALSSSLPTVTTGSVAASTTPNILNVKSPTSSAVQDTQTVSDISSSAPNSTSLIADTKSPLAPTTTLSSQPPQLTRTPPPSDEVLALNSASLPAATSTSTDIPLPTSPVATSTGNEIPDGPSHIPELSSVQSTSELLRGNALGTSGVGGPTEVLDALNSAISASGVLLAATTDQTQTTATLNITATTTSTSLPDKAPTPTSSSTGGVTTTDGNSVESPTTSPGVPVDLSVSTSEATDATSISPTVTVASSSVAEILSSSTDTTLTTATPSDSPPSDGDVFPFSAPVTPATSSGSPTTPATVPTNTPTAIALVNSSDTPGVNNALQAETSPTVTSSAGDTFTASLVTTITNVVTTSVVDVSGTSSLIPVTTTFPTVVPTVVPASPSPPKRPLPIVAIAAPISVVVIFILLVLGIWCYRRRQHVRDASHHAFDFSQALETHEESVPQSELPTFPTLLPIQGPRGWNDPPAGAFASAGPAKDPFADSVSTNAFRPSVEPFNTRSIRRVSMADPFADPPVVMFSSQGEAPSRLSKASWYDVRDAPASVTFSNVVRAV